MNTLKYLLWVGAAVVTLFPSCKEKELDKTASVFETSSEHKTPFDSWLEVNYLQTYNIDYKYRMEDIESDYSKNLSPADVLQSMRLAKIIKHAWLEAYVETAGIDFMRRHAPAILHIIGSASWNNDGTMTLGQAEGGLKITLCMVNWLDAKDIQKMNRYFFRTMHHEFTHILQQDVDYPQEYNLISANDYRPNAWFNWKTTQDYASLGFISSYAGSMPVEDITEVTCCFVTFTDEEWDSVFLAAGEEGRKKLNQKVAIMKQYMLEVWKIDMDKLRNVVRRRMDEVVRMELLEPQWYTTPVKMKAVSDAALQQLSRQLREQWKDAAEYMDRCPNCCHVHNASLINILQHDNN